MRDYQHAARLYLDRSFSLSPKNRFLYHVVFEINPLATGVSLNQNEKLELGMIVKRCDLPSYNFNVEQKNQYNYKNYVQTGIQYQPVTIVLHDDMSDVATAFWKSYYQHYIVDTNRPESNYSKKNFDNAGPSQRFGLDTGNNERFFKSISIFQLSRGLFTEYQMMAPIVNDWNNGSMDQSDGTGLNEHSFSISYSGVLMKNGEVGSDPQGFATFRYDKTPSPNALGGDSIFGVLGGITQTASLLGKGNILGAVIAGGSVYDRIKSGRATRGAKEELIGVVKDAARAGTNNLGATSKPGVSFPKNLTRPTDANTNTRAKSVMERATKTKDGQILLSPFQGKTYLENNYDAKSKFAKFVSFRLDKNLDVNDVANEWKLLTATEQSSYLDKAPSFLSTLIKRENYQYTIQPNDYNKFVAVPLADATSTEVNKNNANSDQGTTVSSISGSAGYQY